MSKRRIPSPPPARNNRSLSAIPVCWSASPEGKSFLKDVPRKSFKAFQDKRATATDWYNLSFRLKVGLEIAKKLYIDETVQGFTESLDATVSIRKRYHASGDTLWEATVEEMALIESGLDAVETMHEENTRRDMRSAYQITDQYMKANL